MVIYIYIFSTCIIYHELVLWLEFNLFLFIVNFNEPSAILLVFD